MIKLSFLKYTVNKNLERKTNIFVKNNFFIKKCFIKQI